MYPVDEMVVGDEAVDISVMRWLAISAMSAVTHRMARTMTPEACRVMEYVLVAAMRKRI